MMQRSRYVHVAAVAAYALVAIVFSWPLLPHLATHFTGDPGGDTGVYVWNQWVFQHGALVEHRNPLRTDHIFSLTGRPVDLTQHNYTLFLNAVALPLYGWLGGVVTFNLVLLAMTVLTAWTTFVLARRVTNGATLESWIAGLAFGWAPLMVARTTGHASLVAAAPLAAFFWSLHRVERSQRFHDSAIAGMVVAWAAFCDAYFAVYCLMIAAIYIVSRMLRLDWHPAWRQAPGVWILDLGILLVAGLVAGLAFGRGGRLQLWGMPISVRGLYTPVLLLTVLTIARLAVFLRPHVRVIALPQPQSLRAILTATLAGAVLLSPVLFGASLRLLEGSWVTPPLYWRSSPAGVDLLAFITPNPAHPLMTWLFGSPQLAEPSHYVEYTAGVSLVAIGILLGAWRRAPFSAPGWIFVTLFFAALALGPFVHLAGLNTRVPGPWALLRYMPVVGLARMPTRFAIVAALGLAVLFAQALVALGRRHPAQRTRLLAAVTIALLVELWPGARPLYSADIAAVYDIIRADPRDVRVLELPSGVRDGVTSAGNFSARYQFHQTRHGKRLVGGYLSRVSSRRFTEVRQWPTLAALMQLSEGRALTPAQAGEGLARAPYLIQKARIGYVVVHPSRTPPALLAFAQRALRLEELARDGDAVLYRPHAPPVSLDSSSDATAEGRTR